MIQFASGCYCNEIPLQQSLESSFYIPHGGSSLLFFNKAVQKVSIAISKKNAYAFRVLNEHGKRRSRPETYSFWSRLVHPDCFTVIAKKQTHAHLRPGVCYIAKLQFPLVCSPSVQRVVYLLVPAFYSMLKTINSKLPTYSACTPVTLDHISGAVSLERYHILSRSRSITHTLDPAGPPAVCIGILGTVDYRLSLPLPILSADSASTT